MKYYNKALTPKQEKFATEFVNNGGNASAAYRHAYNTSRMKEASIHRKAHDLAHDVKVGARINKLKAEASDKAMWSFEHSVQALAAIAREPDRQSDAVAAIRELNKMLGFNQAKKIEYNGSVDVRHGLADFYNDLGTQ